MLKLLLLPLAEPGLRGALVLELLLVVPPELALRVPPLPLLELRVELPLEL